MSTPPEPPAAQSRCTAMRRSFDDAFALPVAETITTAQELLAVRIGGDAYALRLSEIAGLHVDLTVVPVPSSVPHLRGIASIRGIMAPIYDLAGLLGYPPASTTHWVAMIGAPHNVGLALESFEAHVRVRETQLNHKEHGEAPRTQSCARDAVHAAGALRPILQVSALIHLIRERAHDG